MQRQYLEFIMNTRKKKIIFLSIFLLLIAQYIFALTIDEPYPAIVFPAFAHAPKNNDYYINKPPSYRIIIENKKSGKRVDKTSNLFKNMPPATKYRLMKRICPLDEDLERERQSFQKHHKKSHYKFKMWLKHDLANGYYKRDSKEIKEWVASWVDLNENNISIEWIHDKNIVHHCEWSV